MGSAIRRANDLGIIYDKNGLPAGATYVDVAGVTQLVGTLTGSYTEQVTVPLGNVDYSHPYVGARDAISMFVDVTLAVASSIKLKLQGRYASTTVWTDIQTVREDTGVVVAEQTLAAAGTYLLQTASILAVSQIRVVAEAAGGVEYNAGDSIVVRAWVQ